MIFRRLILVLVGLGFWPGAAAWVHAHLDFEQTVLEASVEEGGEARVEFVFRNAGPRDIVVTDVESSCGCTVAERPVEPVRPGEIGRIAVVYRSGRAQGEQSQVITLRTSEGEKHVLRMKIDVRPRVMIEPRLLIFRGGDLEARTIKVVFGLATPVVIRGLEFSAPGFELDRPVENDGTVATIWIRHVGEATADARVVARLRSLDAAGREHVDQLYLRHRP